MPSFKPKTVKKIKISRKNSTTLDGTHTEFINTFSKDKYNTIPKLKNKKKELMEMLENKDCPIHNDTEITNDSKLTIESKLSIEQIMDIKDNINEINELSLENYSEVPLNKVLPSWNDNLLGTHTFSHSKNFIIIDANEKISRYFFR